MRKIPGEGVVEEAILKVFRENREVDSQKALRALVLERLRKNDEEYTLSEDRVRKLAARLGFRVLVLKRASRRKARRCYVCGGELKVLKARDLYGAEVVVGRKCTLCGFRMDRDNLVPRRYIFRRFA